MERREMGLVVGLMGLNILVELVLKHLALSMAIVAMVAAIDVNYLLLDLDFGVGRM